MPAYRLQQAHYQNNPEIAVAGVTTILRWHAGNLSAAAQGHPRLNAEAERAQEVLTAWEAAPAGRRQRFALSARGRGLVSQYGKAAAEPDHDRLMARYRDSPLNKSRDQVGVADLLSSVYVKNALERGAQSAAANVVSVAYTPQQNQVPTSRSSSPDLPAIQKWLLGVQPAGAKPGPGMNR